MKLRQGLLIAALLVTGPGAYAGFDEGWAAYVDGDYATALQEWRSLAEQGDGTAQYNIAVMYDTGQGVAQDDVEAYAWYSLAVTKLPPGPDLDRAERRRLVVVQFMTVDQIAQAEALVRAWSGPKDNQQIAAAATDDTPPAPAVKPVPVTPVVAQPAMPKPKPPAAAPAPAPSDRGGAFVAHLASVRSEQDVTREWQRLRRKYAPLLDQTDLVVQRIDLQGRGTFYRILAGAFPDQPGAEKVCASLSAKGGYCAIVDQ